MDEGFIEYFVFYIKVLKFKKVLCEFCFKEKLEFKNDVGLKKSGKRNEFRI